MAEVDRRFFETLLAQRKLSLRGLAQRLGMQHSQLSLTFSGQRRMQLDEAAALADLFGVPLQRIAQAAGVESGRTAARRVDVIGAMRGNGELDLNEPGVIEKALAPDGLPENAVAVQARTADTPAAWMDTWVFFCAKPEGIAPDAIGRFCLAKVKGGPAVMATIRRGYRDDTYNLSGPAIRESVGLEWAAPVILTRM